MHESIVYAILRHFLQRDVCRVKQCYVGIIGISRHDIAEYLQHPCGVAAMTLVILNHLLHHRHLGARGGVSVKEDLVAIDIRQRVLVLLAIEIVK